MTAAVENTNQIAEKRMSDSVLVLLGAAGGPVIEQGCHGIASALIVNDHAYLIDAGHGTVDQFKAAGILEENLRGIFVTHLHSDHIADLYTLPFLLHSGVRPLRSPFTVLGPGPAGALPPARAQGRDDFVVNPDNPTPGTEDFFHYSRLATAYDQNIRARDEGARLFTEVVEVHDIDLSGTTADAIHQPTPEMEPFEVFRDSRIRVSAILVKHPPVFPAFAFRFDTASGSVVFSGDTAPCQNTIRIAQGADVLVHEAIDLDFLSQIHHAPPALVEHLRASHTDIHDVGRLAEQAGVKTLVLNHLVPGDPGLVDAASWSSRANQGFSGRVVVGTDLARIPL